MSEKLYESESGTPEATDPFTDAVLYLAALTEPLGELANREFWERLASYALDTAGEYA